MFNESDQIKFCTGNLENCRLVVNGLQWCKFPVYRSAFPDSLPNDLSLNHRPLLVLNLSRRPQHDIQHRGDVIYMHRPIKGDRRPLHDAVVDGEWDLVRDRWSPDWHLVEYGNYLESILSACKLAFEDFERVANDVPLTAAYITCDGGKDRTGLFVAIAQRRGGASMETVLREFSLSNLNLTSQARLVLSQAPDELRAVARACLSVQAPILERVLLQNGL